jgi:hypothetical protein
VSQPTRMSLRAGCPIPAGLQGWVLAAHIPNYCERFSLRLSSRPKRAGFFPRSVSRAPARAVEGPRRDRYLIEAIAGRDPRFRYFAGIFVEVYIRPSLIRLFIVTPSIFFARFRITSIPQTTHPAPHAPAPAPSPQEFAPLCNPNPPPRPARSSSSDHLRLNSAIPTLRLPPLQPHNARTLYTLNDDMLCPCPA